MKVTFIKKLFLFGILILFVYSVQAKSNPDKMDDSKKIVWINEISSSTIKPNDKSIFESLKDIIFGEISVNISKPFSLYVQDLQNIVILDQENRGILNIAKTKKGYSIKDVIETGKYPSLISVTDYLDNQLLFTDSQKNKIYRLDIKENKITPFVVEEDLIRPTGIAFNRKTSTIWVVETGRHCVTMLNKEGKMLRHIGKRGVDAGDFNYPTFIWISKEGLVYVVDSMNFRIQIFNADGSFRTVFGKAGDASGYFGRPKGIATDSFGNIYVVDALFHTVQVFDEQGNLLTYFGGPGHNKGEFWIPEGIFIDKENKIYVADSYNSRIQIYQLVSQGEN